MKKEHPGKRTDPKKLMREREKIDRDIAIRNVLPPLKQESVVDKFFRALGEASERRRRRRNPPPQIEGSMMIGFKETDKSA